MSIFRQSHVIPSVFIIATRFLSSSTSVANSELDPNSDNYDPACVFLQKDVQRLLYRVTGLDLTRFTNPTQKTRMLELPVHRLLTEGEWEVEQQRSYLRVMRKLKMPPVMAKRKPVGNVISPDHHLGKLLEHKLLFTDVSYGIVERDRTVLVREKTGELRHSTWDEKFRASQIYFPHFGREVFVPRMFHPDFLQASLAHVSLLYVLNRASVQFEPDDPDFIRVNHTVYDHIDKLGTYDELWSTRFFGGLVFYLVCAKRLDGIILDRLIRRQLPDAADIVKLLSIIHPLCECAIDVLVQKAESDQHLIEIYIKTTATVKAKLSRALEGLIEPIAVEEAVVQ